MSCVALWYREKWDESLDRECDLSVACDKLKYDNIRASQEIVAVNGEISEMVERLQKSEFQCDLLNKEIADKNARLLKLLDENNKLRSQLPKRDSKGRYCKK
jgi:hypothetical protein